jgi:hypothetical protein
MLNIIGWTAFLYVAIKFCHVVLGGSKGYGGTEIPLRTKLRAGEPWLLIGTIAFCALIVGFTSWWGHRFAQRYYADSSDCYAKMMSARALPSRPARFGSYSAQNSVTWYYRFARFYGLKLGIPAETIEAKLEQARIAYTVRYSALGPKDGQAVKAALDALDQCLNGDGPPHGELLNP